MHSYGTRNIKIHVFLYSNIYHLFKFVFNFEQRFYVPLFPLYKMCSFSVFYQLRADTVSEALGIHSACKITDDVFIPAQEFQIHFQILLLLITSLPPTVTYSVLQAF